MAEHVVTREYRKGNWTVNEALVLIEAKKMDDERRMRRSEEGEGRSKPTELRWKWVEDYCWRKGCLRSQNQCNDKWDNLMRDYKKVREYQRRIADTGGQGTNSTSAPTSYWDMERNERKEKNFPSNMLRFIYERLEEVVDKKGDQRVVSAGSASIPSTPYVMARPITSVQTSLPHVLQHQLSAPIPTAIPLSLSDPPTAAPTPLVQPCAKPLPIVDSDTREYSESPAKRRKKGGNGEGTSGGTTTANHTNEVGTAISTSAYIIAEAIRDSEEREESRHRDLINLQERRLKMEESKTEINKRGLDGLVDAINKLANAIFALASHNNQSAPK